MAKKRAQESIAVDSAVAGSSTFPLIFLSHDSRDSDLAEAFENLLIDASGGVLKAFRSSDRKGTSGIEFGAEWYATIMSKLGEASDVVALLTQNSLSRPWILYEVGVARGRLNTPAFGVAFGVSLNAVVGPFAQFQNSSDDEDSLTKLVLQLIRRNPNAAPREEAVRRQVAAFKERAPQVVPRQSDTSARENRGSDLDDIAKLFEEVKIMFREIPDSVVHRLTVEGFADETGRYSHHIFSDLIQAVEEGLRWTIQKVIGDNYPDIDAAIRAGVLPPAKADKGFRRFTMGEMREVLRQLHRAGLPASKYLPSLEALDQLSRLIDMRNRVMHMAQVDPAELAQALLALARFIRMNAVLRFERGEAA